MRTDRCLKLSTLLVFTSCGYFPRILLNQDMTQTSERDTTWEKSSLKVAYVRRFSCVMPYLAKENDESENTDVLRPARTRGHALGITRLRCRSVYKGSLKR